MSDITAYYVPAPPRGVPPPASTCASASANKGGEKTKTYYGNAEPEGKTVILGGTEVVVGGWAAYEATRRRARWKSNPHSRVARPLSNYTGRTYITGQDTLESLIGARASGGAGAPQDPLALSAERLAAALENFEQALAKDRTATVWARLGVPPDAPFAVSTITAEDVRYTIPETSVHELHRIAEDAGIFASNYAREDELASLRPPHPPGSLPPLPAREVACGVACGITARGADRNIARLEAATVPRASAIEAYRGGVAAVFDASAAILERAVSAGLNPARGSAGGPAFRRVD